MKIFLLLLVSISLCSADDALDKAVFQKLKNCGLHVEDRMLFDPFSKISAWIGTPSLKETTDEKIKTQGLLSWAATLKAGPIREAYINILTEHKEAVERALQEYSTHEWAHRMEDYEKNKKDSDVKAVSLIDTLPDPCHSMGTKKITQSRTKTGK